MLTPCSPVHSGLLSLAVLVCFLLETGFGQTVRLVHPGIDCTNCGRLELFINGQWGTVCSNLWNEQDARVACRQLKFHDGGKPAKYAAFGKGQGPIHMSHVNCHGNETSLLQCSRRSGASCSHDDDAGIICESDATSGQSGLIRLVNGSGPTSGRLNIQYHGVWGTACRDQWNIQDSQVVCRQLGFCGGSSVIHDHGAFGMGSGPVWLTEVNCTGHELELSACHDTGWANNSCDHGYDVGVVCKMCDTGSIRLRGGPDNRSGIVTISNNGYWGTMCSYTWSDREARVVCRYLGFDDGLAVDTINFTTQSGSIWLSGVKCTGNETLISDCSHDNHGTGGWGDNDCRHYQDVAVMCLTSSLTSSTVSSTFQFHTTGTFTTQYSHTSTNNGAHISDPDNRMDKTWIIIIVTIIAVVVTIIVIVVVCGVTRIKTSKKNQNYMMTLRSEPNTYLVDNSTDEGACALAPVSISTHNTKKTRDSGVYQEIDDNKASVSCPRQNRMNSYVASPCGPAKCSPRSIPLPAVPGEENDYLQAVNVRKGSHGILGGVVSPNGTPERNADQDMYTQIDEPDSSTYLEPLKLRC